MLKCVLSFFQTTASILSGPVPRQQGRQRPRGRHISIRGWLLMRAYLINTFHCHYTLHADMCVVCLSNHSQHPLRPCPMTARATKTQRKTHFYPRWIINACLLDKYISLSLYFTCWNVCCLSFKPQPASSPALSHDSKGDKDPEEDTFLSKVNY